MSSEILHDVRWMPCQNAFAGTIPAFACMKVVGAVLANPSSQSSQPDSGTLQVTQPDADGQDVVINGPVAIPQNGFGSCTRDFPTIVLYNQADGTPNPGDEWGVGAGGFTLRKGKTGFIIDGAVTTQAPFTVMAKHKFGSAVTAEYDDQTNIFANLATMFFSKLDFILSAFMGGMKIQTNGLTQSTLKRVTDVV